MENLIEITREEAFNVILSKWPQMLVTGKSVSVEQAKDIILHTDYQLIGSIGSEWMGNDHSFAKMFREITGFNTLVPIENRFNPMHDTSDVWTRERRFDLRDAVRDVESKLDFVTTQYVHNSWVACSFINGPHGWCHPDGKIQYIDNVGKWPTVEDILDDWKKISTRWNFLDIWATLMSGEESEDDVTPLVTFHINGDEIKIYSGITSPHSELSTIRREWDFTNIFNNRRELGVPMAWIEEYATRSKAIVKEVMGKYPSLQVGET